MGRSRPLVTRVASAALAGLIGAGAAAAADPNPPARAKTAAEAVAAVPLPIPQLPPAPGKPREKDDGVVLVGGVPVPIPSDALSTTTVRPAAAVAPVPDVPPPATLPPIPVTTEPPIRSHDAPRTLPALTDLPPVAVAPQAAPPPAPPAATVVPPVPAAPQPPAVPAPMPAATAPPALLPGPTPVVPAPLPGLSPDPLPPIPVPPGHFTPGPGPIDVGGTPLPFDSLSNLVDGGTYGYAAGGCSACGGGGCRQCAPGKKPCEPFPARTCVGRFIGLVYEGVCCPDPCYQPRWEPITSAAFFVDSPRPVTQTRVRWDYGNHFAYPDRGELFWARADGNGRGPKPNAPARGVPALDYHEIYLDQEIATGTGSVTISQPYRSVNPTPFAESAAGFGDMQITAKSLLYDSELFLFAFQMRTYIPIGQVGKGLGTGHLSLEPGLIAGVRLSPNTYAVAQVQEWIPIAGDKDYMGAAIKYDFSFNHILWRPVRDVQLVGTWELQGISFQDGLYTDAVLGPQKLSGQTALNMGVGARLFFCDKFDFGAGYSHGITGKALVQDQIRTEIRYRY